MKLATIYLRKGTLFISTMSRTEHDLWLGDGPLTTLAVDTPPSEIGTATRAALSRSRTVPHPESWDGPEDDPLLREAGVRSWKTFYKGAKVVHVELDSELALVPTRNEGPGRGVSDFEDRALHLPATASAEELGTAIEQALARCE